MDIDKLVILTAYEELHLKEFNWNNNIISASASVDSFS